MPEELKIPHGLFDQIGPYKEIGRRWIAHAQSECDVNDIAVAVWAAIKETQEQMAHQAVEATQQDKAGAL